MSEAFLAPQACGPANTLLLAWGLCSASVQPSTTRAQTPSKFVSLFPLSATDLAVQASAPPRLCVWNWLFGAEGSVGWVWWVLSTEE